MGRSPCCDKTGLKKGPWTPEEDQKLIDYIKKHGYGNWRTLPKNAGLQRCGKSCRLRWTNYLRPDIKRGRFSFEEEETIIQLHSILGNKWSAIAARLPGRTDNEIKNYWNTHVRKKLLRMGIDPVTHSPRLDLLDISSILNSSLCNSSHMNLSRFMGANQPMVNPEILKLANSLSSSQPGNRNENQSFLHQNTQETGFCDPQTFNQCQTDVQNHQIQELSSCIPITNEAQQVMNPNLASFSDYQWQNNVIPSTMIQEFMSMPSNQDYYGSDTMLSQLSDLNNLNFFFASSSPTPLNSSSTHINSSSCSTEDERESFCSNIMRFEIPDILDVNGFV